MAGYATGGVENNFDCVTIGYSGAGEPLWTNRYDGPANGIESLSGVAVGPSGNVYVTGYSGSAVDYLTVACSGAGVPLWTNRYSSPGYDSTDIARAVAVDDLDNVFVTGSSGGTT